VAKLNSAATAAHANQLLCRTPPDLPFASASGGFKRAPLAVSLTGLDSQLSASVDFFETGTFDPAYGAGGSGALSIHPTSGPYAGATTVTISGGGLVFAGQPSCRFGDLPPTAASSDAANEQAGKAAGAVICLTPRHPLYRDHVYRLGGADLSGASTRSPQNVPLKLALNGQQFSSTGLLFTYV